MSSDTRTGRREVLKLGAVAAVTGGVVGFEEAGRVRRAHLAPGTDEHSLGRRSPGPMTSAATLVAPLEEGSSLGPWKIERFLPVRDGAAGILLSDETGASFQLDVCSRDAFPGAPAAPGASVHFDVFLSNGGEGDTPSNEHHGLAAMAIADVIRFNEPGLAKDGLLTLRERLSSEDASADRSV